MRCPKCKKLLRENTDGDARYCQGHTPFNAAKPGVVKQPAGYTGVKKG